jgi:hypothetical protein
MSSSQGEPIKVCLSLVHVFLTQQLDEVAKPLPCTVRSASIWWARCTLLPYGIHLGLAHPPRCGCLHAGGDHIRETGELGARAQPRNHQVWSVNLPAAIFFSFPYQALTLCVFFDFVAGVHNRVAFFTLLSFPSLLFQLFGWHLIRLGLALTNNPSVDTISPIAELCLNHITALCCCLRSLLPFAGPTMQAQVVKVGADLLTHLRTLIGNLMTDGVAALSAHDTAQLMKQTGLLWNCCDALTAVPFFSLSLFRLRISRK